MASLSLITEGPATRLRSSNPQKMRDLGKRICWQIVGVGPAVDSGLRHPGHYPNSTIGQCRPGSKVAVGPRDATISIVVLNGRVCLTTPNGPKKTCGKFSQWMTENRETLDRYFGVELCLGSFNVEIINAPENLLRDLDAGSPRPTIRIPATELRSMSSYLRDAQAWPVTLESAKANGPIDCWLFRRIHSKVRELEVLATQSLVKTHGFTDGDELRLTIRAT